MTVIKDAPTSAEVLAKIGRQGGRSTVLARAISGPFEAQVSRWDANDGDGPYTDLPRIEIDCSDQDGGECFFDLTVLPEYVDAFAAVVAEIVADYKAVTS